MLVSAVILNGGRSSRLSFKNKALLEIEGIPMIQKIISVLKPIFDEIIIISNDQDINDISLGYSIYKDEIESIGPLAGIYTGLLKIKNQKAFFCGCDMPFLNQELIEYLVDMSLSWDIICPVYRGFYEPLHSVYSKNCISSIEYLISKKRSNKVQSLFSMVRTEFIDICKAPCKIHPYDFMNINTWEDYYIANTIAKSI